MATSTSSPDVAGEGSGSPTGRFFAGWVVVGAAFLLLMANSGFAFYGQAVYLDALTREQGFATGAASAGQSIVFVFGGLAGPLVGRLIARRDVRLVVVGGVVISSVCLFLLGRVTEIWQLYLVDALFGVGFTAGGLVPATTVITRWFQTRRSVALAIASTGLSVGGLTVTQLASWWINRDGLAEATPWLALVWLAIALPVVPFLYPDPASRGTLADGEVVGAPIRGVAYAIAIRSRFFRSVTVGYVLVLGMQVGGISQIVKLGNERAGEGTGSALIAGLTIASVVCRLIGGVVAAKAPLVGMALVFAAFQGVGLVLLAVTDGPLGLLLAAILFGATVGNILMLQPLLIAESMGTLDYPRIFAMNQLVVVVGVATGPFLLGFLHDVSGYQLSYTVAAVLCWTGAVVMSRAGPVERTRQEMWT